MIKAPTSVTSLAAGLKQLRAPLAGTSAPKNRKHPSFIPAPEFCLSHLPAPCQEPSVFDYVKNVSARTVRLRVGFTSWDRPFNFPFSGYKGSDVVHVGSGWVTGVQPGNGPCRCPDCSRSSSPCQTWHKVYVNSACHVVYDSEEAKATRVDIFYEDEGAVVEGRMKTIWGIGLGAKFEARDKCTMLCATHDDDLAQQLLGHVQQVEMLWKSLQLETFWSKSSQNLCVVVSHPHGQPKKVTVGETTSRTWFEMHTMKFSYSTDTCPGSSGAPVLVLGFLGIVDNTVAYSWLGPHSEGEGEGGHNRSGIGVRVRLT